MMAEKCFFFAGGGTGGHIYPAIAVAEKIAKLDPAAKIHFFCSCRDIDTHILTQAGYEFTVLPAKGFSARPDKAIEFFTSFLKSYRVAKQAIAEHQKPMVIGIGGFVAAPVCLAGHKLNVPVALINVDILPGRANKLIGRWASEIFVQFEETVKYFSKRKATVHTFGCPLRSSFEKPGPDKAIKQLGLASDKKILLITGASSGSQSINDAVCSLLVQLNVFANDWQIVHLTGAANYEKVKQRYAGAKIAVKVLGYYDDMANLLAAADLVIGRSGAVSVAEYAAAGAASVCMPYPHHKDMHQYLNAGKLVEAGAAIIVDDLPDETDRAEWLWEELEELMKSDEKRRQMKAGCTAVAKKDAALRIAEKLTQIQNSE